ncbi:MAG: hypothetical protein IKT41_00345 [Clostridia bacterium]|nr:hypothetical protein [Clostridia bacterium]
MKILDEFILEDKKYICLQKISIDSKLIYICKNLDSNIKVYFIEGIHGKLEETKDEIVIERINKLLAVKSKDVIY